jgi:hypothetical protein
MGVSFGESVVLVMAIGSKVGTAGVQAGTQSSKIMKSRNRRNIFLMITQPAVGE